MFNLYAQDNFKKYLMNFIRGGFIIGCVFTLFLLVNSAFNGDFSVLVGHTELTGFVGILFVVIMGPLNMALIGFVLGLVYYVIGKGIRWCLQWLS